MQLNPLKFCFSFWKQTKQMDFTINKYKLGYKPEVTIPNSQFFVLLQEAGIRKLVSDQYNLLAESSIKHLFPSDKEQLEIAKKHSADFFIQICGGPKYFNENRGKPMLISRHAPFKITPSARIVWLECYIKVLSQLNLPENVLQSFWNYLNVFSNWMVNAEE